MDPPDACVASNPPFFGIEHNIPYTYKIPLNAVIWITYDCNLKCIRCLWRCPRKKFMHFNDFKRIIDVLVENNILWVTINGGEPLLHPHFWDMVYYCKENKLGIKIFTNGTLIDRNTALKIAKIEPISLQISLDGLNKAYRYIRGISDEKVLNTIKFLRNTGVKVEISSVLHKFLVKNREELIKLINFIEEKELTLLLSPLILMGRALEYYHIVFPTYKEYLKIKKMVLETNRRFSTSESVICNACQLGIVTRSKRILCAPGHSTLFINVNTKIAPDSYFFATDLGDVPFPDTPRKLAETWLSDIRFKVARALSRIPFCILHESCKIYDSGDCNHCPAISYLYFDEFYAPNPVCLLDKTAGIPNNRYTEILKEKLSRRMRNALQAKNQT